MRPSLIEPRSHLPCTGLRCRERRGGGGLAKARLGMGAGKEVSIMGAMGVWDRLDVVRPRVVVAYCAGVDAKEDVWLIW